MSWLKDKIDDITKNKNSALNKFLDNGTIGTVADVGIETVSLVKLGCVLVISGITILLFYKFFIQKK